jgi:hypothetical protein
VKTPTVVYHQGVALVSTNRDCAGCSFTRARLWGFRARIHPISRASYANAQRGDSTEFAVDSRGETDDLNKAWYANHYRLTGNSEFTFLLTAQIEGVSEHCEVHSPDSLRLLQLKLALLQRISRR